MFKNKKIIFNFNVYDTSIVGIVKNISPIILTIALSEFLRYMLISKFKDNTFLFNLSFKNKKLSSISYNLDNSTEEKSIGIERAIKQKFQGKDVDIFWQDYNEMIGSGCQEESFSAVKGEV